MNTHPKFEEKELIPPFNSLDKTEESSKLKESNHFPEDEKDKPQIKFVLKSLKSNNFEDLSFTNYLSSKNCKEYNVLKEIYDNFKKGIDILNIFRIEEMECSNILKLKRLCIIISRHRNRNCHLKCLKHIKTTKDKKCFEKNILKILKCKYRDEHKNIPLRIYLKK